MLVFFKVRLSFRVLCVFSGGLVGVDVVGIRRVGRRVGM